MAAYSVIGDLRVGVNSGRRNARRRFKFGGPLHGGRILAANSSAAISEAANDSKPYNVQCFGEIEERAPAVGAKLETKASSHQGQCIPAGSSASLPRMVFITVSIITMRCRLFPANSACDCLPLRFAKFRPQFSESCGATYRRICKTFSVLQSISAPLTNSENSVQIDA